MTREEMRVATVAELEARRAAIATEIDADGADLNALDTEVRGINEELEARRQNAASKAQIRSMVAGKAGGEPVVKKVAAMTEEEIRSSHEYAVAYANDIKNGNDKESRALLTNLVSGGQVPVPTIVEERIRTAWEREEILSRVGRSNVPGILRIGFELSATDAAIHVEGAAAPTEETLTIGVVTLTPQSVKKWITISDEAMDLSGEEFLEYIFDEITHKIFEKAAATLIALIAGLPATATATSVSANKVTMAPELATVATAIGAISGEASDIVVIMNRATWAVFKAVQYAGGYNVDPFEGRPVLFTNALKAYDAASTGEVYAIVGDLANGARANFPNGDDIEMKFDELSLAEKDLVKVVGRMYVGLGAVADKHFALVAKPAAEEPEG